MPGDLYYRASVSVGGASYDMSADLSSLTVDQTEGLPDSLSIEAADPYRVLSHALQEGMDVEVELGTDDDHAVVFRGRVYRVAGSFPLAETPTITLQAYDPSMEMGLQERNRVWSDMALSDIVTSIASDYFSETDVAVTVLGDPQFPDGGLRQQEETDLAFLRRLAVTYGCILRVTAGTEDDTFHFVSQYSVMSGDPDLTVCYGRSQVQNRLLNFESTASAGQIELPRALSGIDYHTGRAIDVTVTDLRTVGSTDDAFFTENLTAFGKDFPDKVEQLTGLLSAAPAAQTMLRSALGSAARKASPAFTTEAQQSALAQNQFSTSLLGMRARGATVGLRQMAAQTNMSIQDVGGRFSGTWFLSRVRHIVDRAGYRTEFECRR